MCSLFLRACLFTAFTSLSANAAVLRVCADPNNMPYSNQQEQGFENKIAQRAAEVLGDTLEYTWWSQRRSFVKHSLNEGRCDVVLGIPASLPDLDATKPYYRSTYVFVSRQDRKLELININDSRLARMRIGISMIGDDYAPPAFALARRGITQNIIGFSSFGAYGESEPGRKIIDAVDRGEIDIAIVWGPFAGYFAKNAKNGLTMAPVEPPEVLGVPFTYAIAMGVRKGDSALLARLNMVLDREAAEIRQILVDYGVPQVR